METVPGKIQILSDKFKSISLMLNILKSLTHGTDLKRRAFSGSFWTVLGFGGQKALQLASNLILTRLLFPEAFGLMALVTVMLVAVTMFSDVGIRPAIIQAKSANNLDFLNTAWTLQIIRGFFLWGVLCAIAYPASRIYGEPDLFPLLCFCGISAVAEGFRSINIILAERELKLKKVMLIKLVAQVVGIVSMVSLAVMTKSVWALAIGTLCGLLAELILGYATIHGHKHKLCWDTAFAKQIFHFGKWIFWSTTFTFFSGQGIRMIEGHFVSTKILAMIAIAGTIAWMFGELIERFMGNILFPALSRIYHEEPQKFAPLLIKLRTRLMFATAPLFGVVSLLSVFIIDLLYDDRYAFAGQVLCILAINSAIRTMPQIYQSALLAQGKTRLHFYTVGILAFWNVSGLIAGYHLAGIFGMLIGSGIGYLIGYSLTLLLVRKSGWVSPKWEVVFIAVIAAFAAVSFNLHLKQLPLDAPAEVSYLDKLY